MKPLALIGCPTPAAAETYWRILALEAAKARGPGTFPALLLSGFRARTYQHLLQTQDWRAALPHLHEEARDAQRLGAQALVIGSLSLNPAAPTLRKKTSLPLLDLPTALLEKCLALGFTRLAVLGLRSPTEEAYLRTALPDLTLLTPDPTDQTWLRHTLDQILSGHPIPGPWPIRLCHVQATFLRQKAQALLLADPALTPFLTPDDNPLLPTLDLATTHAWAAALWALEAEHLPAPPCVAV